MMEFFELCSILYKVIDENNFLEESVFHQPHNLRELNQKIEKTTLINSITMGKRSLSINRKSNIREEKIVSLKNALQKGLYNIKYEEIAEKIISTHILSLTR